MICYSRDKSCRSYKPCRNKVHHFTIDRKLVLVLFHMAKVQMKIFDENGGEKGEIHVMNICNALFAPDMIIFRFICVNK